MTAWTPLTKEPFVSEDGHIVLALSTEDELKDMGNALRNGLGDFTSAHLAAQMRRLYSDMGREGRFQVVQILTPSGQIAATARLYVRAPGGVPELAIRFLRGAGNRPIAGDSPVSEAMSAYLAAVNISALEHTGLSVHGFARSEAQPPSAEPAAPSAEPAAPSTPIEAARTRMAAWNAEHPDGALTLAQALARGWGKIEARPQAAPAGEAAKVDSTWDVPGVGVRTYEGEVAVRPLASEMDIHNLGRELEVGVFNPAEAARYARLVAGGEFIVAEIRQAGAVEAFAEYRVRNGSALLERVTGYGGEPVTSGTLARAAQLFARDMTMSLEIGEDAVVAPGGASVPTMQRFIRSVDGGADGGPLSYGGGDADDEEEEYSDDSEYDDSEEDEDEDEDEYRNKAWTPLVDDTIGTGNDMTVAFAKNEEFLEEIGEAMENPMESPEIRRRYAAAACAGQMHHYAVYDDNGRMVGCGSVIERGGVFTAFGTAPDGTPVRPLGLRNEEPSAAVNIAIHDALNQINLGYIKVNRPGQANIPGM